MSSSGFINKQVKFKTIHFFDKHIFSWKVGAAKFQSLFDNFDYFTIKTKNKTIKTIKINLTIKNNLP